MNEKQDEQNNPGATGRTPSHQIWSSITSIKLKLKEIK